MLFKASLKPNPYFEEPLHAKNQTQVYHSKKNWKIRAGAMSRNANMASLGSQTMATALVLEMMIKVPSLKTTILHKSSFTLVQLRCVPIYMPSPPHCWARSSQPSDACVAWESRVATDDRILSFLTDSMIKGQNDRIFEKWQIYQMQA